MYIRWWPELVDGSCVCGLPVGACAGGGRKEERRARRERGTNPEQPDVAPQKCNNPRPRASVTYVHQNAPAVLRVRWLFIFI